MDQISPSITARIQRGLARLTQRQAIADSIVTQSPIQVGDMREFYSTAVGRPHDNPRLCHYTGQTVKVIGVSWAMSMPGFDPDESETVFTVQADDGVQFDAFAGELNGWYERTNQYVLPNGSYSQRAAG